MERTGLTYDTVDIISNYPAEHTQIIDLLVLSGILKDLLKDFSDYAHSNLQHGLIIDVSKENSADKERKIVGNELRMIRKYDISTKLNGILEFLRSCYWNEDLKQGVDIQKKDSVRMIYFADILKQYGLNDKDIRKIISEVSNHYVFDELYNELKFKNKKTTGNC